MEQWSNVEQRSMWSNESGAAEHVEQRSMWSNVEHGAVESSRE